MFKGFCFFPVSRRFPYSRDFGVSLFPDTLTFQKCLETGKTTKSIEKIIIVEGFCHFSCFRHFLDSKGSRNKNDQTPWKNHYFLGFFLFLDNFFTKKMSRNMINNKVAWINDFPKGFCHFFCFWTFYCIQKCLETGQQKHPMLFPFPPILAQFDQAQRRRLEARHEKCTRYECTLPTRDVRSVPVRSVLSRRSH